MDRSPPPRGLSGAAVAPIRPKVIPDSGRVTNDASPWPMGWEWGWIAVFVVASFVGANAYIFPGSNHFVSVPFIKQILDPGLYPGDPLLAERQHFLTFYNGMIAWIVEVTGSSVEMVFHLLYALALCGTYLCFFRLAMAVARQRQAALCATAFLFIGSPSLGGVMTLESHLMERSLVLPIQLLSIAWLIDGRVRLAFALAGVSFLVHPLSGVYCCVALLAGGLLARDVPLRRVLVGFGLFVLLALPVALPKFLGGGPSLPFFADREWLDLLMMRSASHIVPTSWPPSQLIGAGLFAVGFFVLASGQRVLVGLGAGIVCLCLSGFLFVEWLPISLAVQLQLTRSYRFLAYLAFALYAAHLLGAQPGTPSPSLQKRWLVAAGLAVFFFGPGAQLYRFPGAVLMVLIWMGARVRRHRFFAVPLLAGIAVCTLAGWSLSGGGPWIGDALDPRWRAVQDWARTETSRDAVFIVPPRLPGRQSGFRVFAERASFGDWKDGTQAFFNPEFGVAWLERMRALGFDGDPAHLREGYRNLDAARLREVATQVPDEQPVFAVVESEHVSLEFPVSYENPGFKVVRLR